MENDFLIPTILFIYFRENYCMVLIIFIFPKKIPLTSYPFQSCLLHYITFESLSLPCQLGFHENLKICSQLERTLLPSHVILCIIWLCYTFCLYEKQPIFFFSIIYLLFYFRLFIPDSCEKQRIFLPLTPPSPYLLLVTPLLFLLLYH